MSNTPNPRRIKTLALAHAQTPEQKAHAEQVSAATDLILHALDVSDADPDVVIAACANVLGIAIGGSAVARDAITGRVERVAAIIEDQAGDIYTLAERAAMAEAARAARTN